MTVTGKNYEECQRKLFDQYGTNYEIVSKGQKLKPGLLWGLGQKEYYEVTYNLKPPISDERTPYTHPQENKMLYSTQPFSYQSPLPVYNSQPKNSESDKFVNNRDEVLKSVASTILAKQQTISANTEVNDKLDKLLEQVASISAEKNIKHESITKIEKLLADNEFSFSYITMITEKIRSKFSLDDLDDFELVEKQVVDWIGQSIEIAPKQYFRPPHVVVLVGPTGVGKTTTIAKFAAKQRIDAKNMNRSMPKLSIMTIDTMRVGALEQLTRFGQHLYLQSDVQKAEKKEDVKKIYEDYKDSVDTIYIDTAGYSPNDAEHIGKMKAVLDVPDMNPDTYLVMSASTKAGDMENIIQNYEPFGYRAVIVTKCDETDRFGNVISTLYEKHKSLSYICDGQSAARNLEMADVKFFLMNLRGFKIDRVHIDDVFGEK